MKHAPRILYILLAVLCFAGLLKATLPKVLIGNWTATSNLHQAASSSVSVLLPDSRILTIGGENSGGPLASAEFFNTDGTVSSAAPMKAARSRHFAVVLSDGRVLVGGGVTTGGGTTNTAEIYDPSANTWTEVGVMTVARANATAAVLSDGRVVIAGGDNAGAPSNTIEVFDLPSGTFSFAGSMSASRTQHAMAVLQDGRVLIVGGTDGTNPLASSDIFDPASGNISGGPDLATARYAASATTLLNGQVAVIGGTTSNGNGGTTDLSSIEVFDPASGAFSSAGASLATAREGHQAFLQPNNNSVLIVGGTAGGTALSSSELFTAQVATSNGTWSYSVSATGSMNSARAGASGSANQLNGPTSAFAPKPGYVVIGGGTDATGATLASTELYGFPTVQTDKDDYPPGTTVNISGSGFQPNETVSITLVESPLVDTHGPYTVTADPAGNISDSSFTTDLHDESVRFFMNATGNQSGRVAQNTFTDAIGTTTALTSSLNPSTYGQSVTFTATTTQTGGSPVTEGCITLQDGNNTVGAQTPVNANGIVTWTISLAAGSHSLQASYQDRQDKTGPCGTGNFFANSHSQPNLSQTVNPKALTVTGISASDHVYDGTKNATLNFTGTTLQGLISGDSVSLNSSTYTATFASKDVGTGIAVTITGLGLTGAQAGDYTLTQPTGVSGNITPKALTVTGLMVADHVYDGTTSATLLLGGASLSGVVTGDTVTLNSSSYTARFASKNVGSGIAVAVTGLGLSGPQAGDYTLTQPTSLTGNITKRPITVTAATNTKPYDGTTSAAASPTTTTGSLVSGDTANFSEAYTTKNVGTGLTLVPSGSVNDGNGGNNYALTFANNTTGVITARAITVTAATNTKQYDGTTSTAATPMITSGTLAAGDTASFTEVYATKNVGTGLTLTASGTVSDGNGGNNYAVTFLNNTTGVITARPITVTAATDTKVYDGTTSSTATPAITTGSLVSGDTASFTQVFDSKNAGTRTLTPSGSVSDGNGGNNYAVTFKTASGSITVRSLTVTAAGVNKQYDGTTSATVTLSDNRISGDLFTDSYIGATFVDKSVGANKTITVTGISISGTDAGNYSVTPTTTTTTASITARPLTITATGISKVYEGTTAATVNLTDNRISGDVFTDNYTAANFSDANAGMSKTVNVTGISISGPDSGNYSLQNNTVSTTADITPATLTLSVTAAGGTYTSTAFAAVCSISGAVAGDTVSPSITYSSGGVPVLAAINAGSYLATCTAIASANYQSTPAQAAFMITPAALTIVARDAKKNFGETLTFAGTEFTTNGLLGRDAVTSITLTSPGADATASVSGSPYPITPSAAVGSGLSNYSIGYVNGTLTVNKATFTGTATAAPTDPNTVAYGQTLTVTVNLNSYSIGGVPLLQPHPDPQDGTKQLPESLTVYLVPVGGDPTQAVKFGSSTAVPTYDNSTNTSGATKTGWTATISAPAPTPGNYSAFVYGDDSGDNQLIGANLADAGYFYADTTDISYPILQSGKIDVTQASVTGSFTVSDKVYDSNPSATINNRSLTGVIRNDNVSLAGGSATFSDKNVGNGKTVTGTGFTLSGTNAANYTLTSSTLTTTANITPLTITGSFTASNKVYDATTAASIASRSLSGVLGSDSVSLTGGDATFADKNVGTGKTVTGNGFTLTGPDAGDYTLASNTLTATADITPVHIVGTFTAANKVYDGTTAATVGARSVAPIAGDNLSLIGGTANFSDKNVGVGKTVTLTGATLSGADAGNYVLDSVATTTADITALHITGKFTAQSKQYDGKTSATVLTKVPVGAISGDNVSLTGGTAAFSDKNVGPGKTVTLTEATLTGSDAGNYILDSVATTTADITALHITGSFTADNKVYDGNNSATVLTRSLVGAISGDSISLSGGTASFADKNVGTGKTVTISGPTLTGADAGNYVLNSVATATADITALHITGKFTAQSKQYDGNTSATVTTELLVGTIAGDNVSLSGGTATFSDKNVGTGKMVTLTGATLTGIDAGDYILDSVATTTADITALHITGNFTTPSKQYDGNTSAAVLTEVPVGAIGGDNVSLTGGTATFSDKNVGKGKTVTLSGASLSGSDAGNYVLDSVATTAADITARPLTVTATGTNKIYDGTATATVTLFDDRVAGDVFNDSYTSANFSDKTVGNEKIVSVSGISISGTDAGNYTFNTSASTAANITARSLTVTATGVNRVYDATTTATVTLSDNRVTGDVFTDSYASATFADKNVGTNKIVSVSGISMAGTDAGNYSLTSTTATTMANITGLAITGSITAANKVYDGTTVATIASRALTGVISGDGVSYIAGTATFSDKNVGSGKTIAALDLTLSGADAGNYIVSSTATTTASISPAPITVTADPQTKVFGTTDVPLTYKVKNGTLTALFGSDTFSGGLTRVAGDNVGIYAIQQGTLDAGADYTITYAGANLTITQATSATTVNSSPNSSVFGQSVTFTATLTDVSSGSTGTPTGSVQFYIDGNPYGSPTALTSGSASIVTAALSVSTTGHSIYAKYLGDQNFVVNTSNTVTQVVNKASTYVNVSPSLSPSTLNQVVTFTATVSAAAPGAGTPTGTVAFYLDSLSGTLLGTGTVTGGKVFISTAGVPVSQHTVYAVYSGDGNFVGNTGTVAQLVHYLTGGMCAGDVGHAIRQPINPDGSSTFKLGSVVPTKFAVCDVNGNSIGTAGVVVNYYLTGMGNVSGLAVDESVYSNTPDVAFRWDATAMQWIFNQATKNNSTLNKSGVIYSFAILLNDGTSITFAYALK